MEDVLDVDRHFTRRQIAIVRTIARNDGLDLSLGAYTGLSQRCGARPDAIEGGVGRRVG